MVLVEDLCVAGDFNRILSSQPLVFQGTTQPPVTTTSATTQPPVTTTPPVGTVPQYGQCGGQDYKGPTVW